MATPRQVVEGDVFVEDAITPISQGSPRRAPVPARLNVRREHNNFVTTANPTAGMLPHPEFVTGTERQAAGFWPPIIRPPPVIVPSRLV